MEQYFQAIDQDNLETLRKLPPQHVNNKHEGSTLLYKACEKGRYEMVRYLLSLSSILINETTSVHTDGIDARYTPLFIACKNGHAKIVRLLLERLDVELERLGFEVDWSAPLCAVCENGHLEIVRLFLEREYIDMDWNEPLCIACEYGHLEIVQLLLDIEDIDVDWNDSLHAACFGGHLEIVLLLLERPEIDISSGHCFNPLYAACEKGHLEIVKLLLERDSIDLNEGKDTPLHTACWNGHLEITKLLLERPDIEINAGGSPYTPLAGACKNGHLGIVKLLLERPEIDINEGPRTPLYAACEGGHSNIVKILLERPEILVDLGRCLRAACQDGHLEVVTLLLEREETDINEGNWVEAWSKISVRRFEIAKLLSKRVGTSSSAHVTETRPRREKPRVMDRNLLGPLAPKLNKYEWDTLDACSDWHVFKPLLQLSKSTFLQHTIDNSKFMQTIKSTDNAGILSVMKHLTESFLYDTEWPMPTHWSEWLTLLFLIDSSALEWPKLMALCVGELTELIDMEMVAGLIKSIHKYQQFREWLHIEMKESFLSKLEHYAFSYIATHCREESTMPIYKKNILSDSYFDPYYKMMNHLDRLDKIVVEIPSPEMNELKWDALFNAPGGDVAIGLPPLKCHRTILCTLIPHFGTHLDKNEEILTLLTSPAMVHIARYCYGIGDEIRADNLVPLILLSNRLGMRDVFELSQSQVVISMDNFFGLLHQLDDYVSDISMEPLIERLIEFGIQHAKDLFIPRNASLVRGPIIELVKLRK